MPTGGEPTHYHKELIELINMVHEFDPAIQIIISTNGLHVDKLIPVADKVSSFAISRHHWQEETNQEIFGCVTTFTEGSEKLCSCCRSI